MFHRIRRALLLRDCATCDGVVGLLRIATATTAAAIAAKLQWQLPRLIFLAAFQLRFALDAAGCHRARERSHAGCPRARAQRIAASTIAAAITRLIPRKQ